MADQLNYLERGPEAEGNGNGNVYLERLRYPTNHVITQELVRIMYHLMQEQVRIMYHLMQILDQQMHNDNDPLLHQLMQHIQNNNRLLLGNVVPNGNVQIGHSDPDRANPGDGITINNLLALYVGAQGAIFNSAFFVEGRTACEIVWTPLILSGLVSVAIIASVFHIFFQQFTRLPQENYWSWVAQKAAIIMMLMAFSVCLLLSCTPVLCISGR